MVGANSDKILNKDTKGADNAARGSQTRPATKEDVNNSTTADLNNDGFVTLDEVVAMREAGLPDDQIINRLRTTGQVFELTEEQRRYLRDRGLSDVVVNEMAALNQDRIGTLQNTNRDVISRPRYTNAVPVFPAPTPATPAQRPF